ncbi:MAG: hypothetical protein B7X67_14325 [Rhizobiales bacterium 39-66-18]|nr:MAG: hypothetical protein B7X67_14325 [Rhizobiales bacterium 39-66-18]
MATIATLTQKADGNLEGTLATLNVTAPIALVPNTRKAKDNEPDYRVISRKNGFELGAPAPGEDPAKKVIIWNPAS